MIQQKANIEVWKGSIEDMLKASSNNIGITYQTPYYNDGEHWRYSCKTSKYIKKNKEGSSYEEYHCSINAEHFSDFYRDYISVLDEWVFDKTIEDCLEKTILAYKKMYEAQDKALKEKKNDLYRSERLERSMGDNFFNATDGQVGDLGDEGWTHLGRD